MGTGISATTGTPGFGRVSLSNIVPFSYRDGMTFQKLLYEILEHVKTTLPADFNKILAELVEQLNAELAEMGNLIINNQREMNEAHAAFIKLIDARIAAINNKTGATEIQRYTLTGNLTLTVNPNWTTNHVITVIVTQDATGGRKLNRGTGIIGDYWVNPEPNSTTILTITRVTGDVWKLANIDLPKAPIDLVNRYRKKIVHNLPFRFPDYENINDLYGEGGLFPQAMTVDPRANELFIVYCPGGTAGFQTVTVHDWTTGAYKRCFVLDGRVTTAGVEIVYDGSIRYLYARITSDEFARYNITVLPANLSKVTPMRKYNLLTGSTFSKTDRGWLFTFHKNSSHKGNLVEWNHELTEVTGMVSLPQGLVGVDLPENAWADATPKMQAFTNADGRNFVLLGGQQNPINPRRGYGIQGMRVFSGGGDLISEALIEPVGMINEIAKHVAITPRFIESEAVRSVNGKLYSLYVTHAGNISEVGNARREGILIFEEYSNSPTAIDFTPYATTSPALNLKANQEGFIGPDQKLYNPVNGRPFESITDVAQFMWDSGQPVMRFHTNRAFLKGMDGLRLPSNEYVVMHRENAVRVLVEFPEAGTRYYMYKDGEDFRAELPEMMNARTFAIELLKGEPSYTPSYRRVGNEIVWDGGMTFKGLAAEEWHTVFQLPEGHQPRKYQYYLMTPTGGSAFRAQLRITAAGVVEAWTDAPNEANFMWNTVRYIPTGLTAGQPLVSE